MLKRKKAFSIALSLVVTLSLILTGCAGKKAGTATPDTNTPTTTTQSTKPTLTPYEVSWYVLGPGQQKDTGLIEQEVNKYLKDKINATLKLTCFDWGTYEQKLKAMIAAGETFDICFTATWPNNYIQNAKNGAYLALNDLLDKFAPKTKQLLGDTFLKASQIDGKNYAIPANKEKARHYGIVYNKTMAAKYNFNMSSVKKLEDLEPMLKVIKEKETGVTPFENYSYAYQFIPWNVSEVSGEVGIMLPDGKFHNQFETPEYKAASELARKWYLAGYYKQDAATAKDKEAEVKEGKFFAYAMNLKPGYVDEQNTNNKQRGFENGQIDITQPTITNNDTMGSMQAISRTSKNPERAMMFLELVNTDKYLNNLINWGIENTHYKKINDNTMQTIPESGYNMNMPWMFGNQLLNYLNQAENPKKWELFEAYNKSAVPAMDLGFIFDDTNVKSERAACINVIKEFRPVLGCGAVDPGEYIPKFNEKLKQSGVDKLLDEMNKQYTVWKAKNK